MLTASIIIPQAQTKFSSDIAAFAEKELYGIGAGCCALIGKPMINMIMMICIQNTGCTPAQEQCFLSKLQSQN